MENRYSQDEIRQISESLSVLHYFQDLARRNLVRYDRKSGKDHYFLTPENKFSVNERKYFDFKTKKGGEIIKAVMHFENKSWKEAMEYLKQFSPNPFNNSISTNQQPTKIKNTSSVVNSSPKILNIIQPNNETLIDYFENRGISREVLLENAKQVHYESSGKSYFGLGIENLSGGYELRNPMIKSKIGKSDISVVEGTRKDEVIVFEGPTDLLSFLQLQKDNQVKNTRTLVALNSVVNADKFINAFQDFEGKIFLCLDGDEAGNYATKKILSEMKDLKIKDVRLLYGISETGHNDLSDYLQKKVENLKKSLNLESSKHSQNGNPEPQSETISQTFQLGGGTPERDLEKREQISQSEQENHQQSGQKMDGENARDGFTGAVGSHLRGTGKVGTPALGTQPKNAQENAGAENSVVGRLSGIADKTGIAELDRILDKHRGQKPTNEQVAEIVSTTCFVSDDKEVHLKEHLNITDELKKICRQFKSGGMLKEGRGILDEYYTDTKIVEAVRNLIKDHFSGKAHISVLEPSVGTGNFINASKNLSENISVNSFEINETSAKIAKILHPEITVNLRSFETGFIFENGTKKNPENFSEKYDLVLGNPPYGEHRGIYKGLGEESKISKYEDYFVKRSLDSLKPNGILAMVLPSGWMNRQKKLKSAELLEAYRLPAGAFSGTKIGTDIVILKKTSDKLSRDYSDYFEKNSAHILGSIKEKTNRFGKYEEYVSGSLEDALAILEQLQNNKKQVRIGNLFEDLYAEISTPPKPLQKTERVPVKKTQDAEEKNAEIFDRTVQINLAKTKVDEVLALLSHIKFKSSLVNSEILRYEKLKTELSEKSEIFNPKQIAELLNKAEIIIKSRKDRNSEYEIQTKPEIKKGILKYQFFKNDEIVDTALQNSSNISPEQISAFQDTEYDGTLNNRGKHYKFANYFEGRWMHDFYYAEGNIYAKLEQLERDFVDKNAVGGMENQYEKQKSLLESVLPKPKNLEDIIISPNHEFVHQFSMRKVEKEKWNPNTRQTETVKEDTSLAETFKTFVTSLPASAFAGSSSWEVRSFVDNENVTGSDKERNALIRERRKDAANDLFRKYVREELSEETRNRFVAEFNKKFNNIHVPDYSQFPLFSKINKNFKGEPLSLTEVQRAGVGRLTTKGVGLLAHEVGFGKTLSGIISMHEAMQRGNARRPLIVVPNANILKQWVETIFESIPEAKLNILGNLGKDYDLSNFDNKDGEITLVTYEGFNNIGFSRETTEQLASKFSYITESELKSVKNSERDVQIEIQKEKEVEGKMRRGKIYDWEDFGFDHITFDEVHNANHIVGKVRIEDRRFSSDFRNQNQRTSGLGINAWMACQYIQEKNNGRNVSLLSATPFTNKPLEYYSILSLIANKRLEESGYFNVNNFFETFMEADNEMEIGATGDVKFKSNVRRFKNNSLFQQLLSEFIDLKGEEDNPELKRPNRINKEYKIEQNDLTKEQYEILNDSFSEKEPGAILTHILNARLIAISPYLSIHYEDENPTTKEFIENSPKLKLTMDLIAQNKKDIPNAGQIIYSELAVAEFPKLKEYLISEVGFKPIEVGIITGATTKNQRIDIQNDFNSGKIKVIIGSEAIQEGMNLQEKTSDMYLLSLPYNFTSLRQVEGRAWRQGNQWENVRINYMLTNDSIDVFMLQKLQAKQARYLEAMKKGANVVDVSDVNTQELKTAIITKPETRANIEIELLKKKLQNEKDRYVADQSFVLRKFEDYTKVKEKLDYAVSSLKRVEQWAKDAGEDSTWNRHIYNYEANVNRAKQELQETIDHLAKKGVNISEIELQNELTEKKIAEFEEQIEKLPEVQSALVLQYQRENEERLRKVSLVDHLTERKAENEVLFRSEKTKNQSIVAERSIGKNR